MSVVIETTIGDITVDLFTDERPIACLNFMKLCKLKYYNYNLFHTIEQGFIAQTGDPTGAGQGGCSVWGLVEGIHKRFFEAEYLPKIYHNSAGLLSLVSAGKNLVGSQFFFTLGENLSSLDGIHCVIGEVVEGHEILRKLNESIVDERFRPYQDIRITHTVILEDPFADPRGFQVPSRSPSPSAERLQHGRIAADEDIDDTDGKSMQEIQEMLEDREAKARATILEIVGDIPDAEMAPPENVLFVCKLNQVTTDDDLEIIFSRFGKVKCCEVIRDKKTGDSLQYAFVEFEEQKSCEAAYFKMANVLIDDRRIHVDFSQSVAKVKWRGKGRGVEGPDGRLDFNNLNDKGSGYNVRRDSRRRMNSKDRKIAREARHREQDEQRSGRAARSRSRNRTDRYASPADNSRQRDNERRNYRREEDRRERLRSPIKRDREDSRERRRNERRRYSRSPKREPVRNRSAERRISPSRRRPERRPSPAERRRQRDTSLLSPPQRSRPCDESRKRNNPSRETEQPQKDKLKRKKDSKKKKSNRTRTASSDSSESESSSSESSTDSDSSSSSSVDDKRSRRNNKSKKSKKSKSKKSNKKSHKRKK